jgi:hypothetical protein
MIMKKVNSILFIAITILLMIVTGCVKHSQPPSPPPASTSLRNTAPIVHAGYDQYLFLPVNFCTLTGTANDLENNIKTILWRKISGLSFLIEHPDSLSTKVSNLQIGIYDFELTVTDSMGMEGKDTIRVTVFQTPPTAGGGGGVTPIAPKANAGTDKLVYYPANFTNLYGSMSTWGNIIQTISWSKISGPPSFLIETPNSLGTKVSNLQIGVYQFELLVRDTAGLFSKDTCTVIVGQMSTNMSEIIFQNQIWGHQGVNSTLLWGSSIILANVYQYLPASGVFRVYIKKDNSVSWSELIMDDPDPNSWYSFSLMNGNLYIWSYYNETDTPDIKLVY